MPHVPCKCSYLHLPLTLIAAAQLSPLVWYQQLTALGLTSGSGGRFEFAAAFALSDAACAFLAAATSADISVFSFSAQR